VDVQNIRSVTTIGDSDLNGEYQDGSVISVGQYFDESTGQTVTEDTPF